MHDAREVSARQQQPGPRVQRLDRSGGGGGAGRRAISISARPRSPPPSRARTAPNSPCTTRHVPLQHNLTLKIVFTGSRVFTPNPNSGACCTLAPFSLRDPFSNRNHVGFSQIAQCGVLAVSLRGQAGKGYLTM